MTLHTAVILLAVAVALLALLVWAQSETHAADVAALSADVAALARRLDDAERDAAHDPTGRDTERHGATLH